MNPDRESDLYDTALQFGAVWYSNVYRHEGEHRDFAVKTCINDGADIVMVVDSDEIWDPGILQNMLSCVKKGDGRIWRISMRHFWRSLGWICDDSAMPVRFIKAAGHGEQYIPAGLKCWHMGYAQSSRLIAYKMSIHGHKGEIRPNWLSEKFSNWKPGVKDVHPTNCDNFWDPKPFDRNEIGNLVGDHPYFRMEIIP